MNFILKSFLSVSAAQVPLKTTALKVILPHLKKNMTQLSNKKGLKLIVSKATKMITVMQGQCDSDL